MSKRLRYREIRDPIHGLTPVTDIEFAVMDSRPFQRLRRIKQLAFADLGFHGAVHNRFGHSVGVMHIASRIAQHLKNTGEIQLKDSDLQVIRLAALLHDIGHGPYSHISEYLLKHFKAQSAPEGSTEEIHETISRRIIQECKLIKDILGDEYTQQVVDLLRTDQTNPDFKHDLVSGPLDADKMDYLLRDSYFTGVKYGVFDLDRLINVLTLAKDNRQMRLAAKLEGVQAIEQYVLAKYFIAQQVYQHRIRHITDKMIIEGVIAAVEDGNGDLEKLYDYRSDKAYVTQYLKWDDDTVFQSVLSKSSVKSKGKKYFSMLRDRQLLKEMGNCSLTDLGHSDNLEVVEKLKRIREGKSADLRAELTKGLDLKPGFTHVMTYSLEAPLIQRSFGIVDEEAIRIRRPDDTTNVLERESTLYHSIVREPKNYYIQVIGLPKDRQGDRTSKRKRTKNILGNYFGGSKP